MRHRAITVLVTITVVAATLFTFTQAPPAAAAVTKVDFTIEEPFDDAPDTGELIAGSIPGCSSPVVTTTSVSSSTFGPVRVFSGEKLFTCDGGATFGVQFAVAAVGCSPSARGFWFVANSTGALAGLQGGGSLVGNYMDDGSPSDACTVGPDNPGSTVEDNYRGILLA